MSPTAHTLLAAGFLICFGTAAMLAAVEVSLVRVRRVQVIAEAEDRPLRRRQLLALIDELAITLNAVLLLALLCQVGAATIAGYWAQRVFGDPAVSVSSVVVTLLLFVYAEAIPKTAAVASPLSVALRFAPLVRVLARLLRWPVRGVARFADLQAPGATTISTALSERELLASAAEAAREGHIDEKDASLIERSLAFGDTTASSIMVAREAIVSVPATASVADALGTALVAGHRRLVVIGADLDQIEGMVRLRDLAAVAQSDPSASVSTLATETLECSPLEPIGSLLTAMQAATRPIAIVRARDGGTAGMVTIEDIVEELVGEISADPQASSPTPWSSRPPSP